MNRNSCVKSLLVVACGLMAISACADTIDLRSGGGLAVNQRDPNVTVRGASVTVGTTTVPAADVALQQALVIRPYSVWCAAPSGSQWIGVADGFSNSPRYGYIYTTQFILPQAYRDASISVTAAADDACAVYLNGHMIGTGGRLEALTTFSNSTASWFTTGTNTLEFYAHNGTFVSFNPGGLTYSATINYTPVPEPSAVAGLLTGLAAISGSVLRRRV